MINAFQITNYNLSDTELQEYIIFWILAAGKKGDRAAKIVNNWVDTISTGSLFDTLKSYTIDELVELCTNAGTGCQKSKARSIYEIVHSGINLRTCLPDELETIYGIGMKTARCFIIHSRKNAQYAGLDTHLLKFLSRLDLDIPIPKSTPPKKIYLQLEQIVLTLADKFEMSPAEFDLMIWTSYQNVKTNA